MIRVKGRDGIIRIPIKKWKELINVAKGGYIDVQVSVWDNDSPQGKSYQSFPVHVAREEIDPWISYRLIEPGYVGWRQLGIYQREMSSFEETPIVTNRASNTTCLNCHNYPSYSPESMMFHARGKNGGTILYNKGKLSKIDFKSIGPKKNTTYPAWHPEGRYIAFSSNTTHQIFFGQGKQPIEVFDTASDLVIYDTVTGDVLTDPRFMTEESLETFPSWSPDGKTLYFVSYAAESLPVRFNASIRYNLLRVSFDPETGALGSEIDTLYNSRIQGGSVSYPRISPDGRHLMYTLAEYGTFPIWHEEADLHMLDLETLQPVDVSLLNDAENADSYHSWSSNGHWVMYGSRRLDGRYTRLFIAYMDDEGRPHKPFLLPQEDPRQNSWRLMSFNIPEFMSGKVDLPKEAADLFYSED
jgi:Tol biopolymer transport system component